MLVNNVTQGSLWLSPAFLSRPITPLPDLLSMQLPQMLPLLCAPRALCTLIAGNQLPLPVLHLIWPQPAGSPSQELPRLASVCAVSSLAISRALWGLELWLLHGSSSRLSNVWHMEITQVFMKWMNGFTSRWNDCLSDKFNWRFLEMMWTILITLWHFFLPVI